MDVINLTADEAAALRNILGNDKMLAGLANASVGMDWINKILSFATPGPVKLVLKWNQGLLSAWRKSNEGLAKTPALSFEKPLRDRAGTHTAFTRNLSY
jgi:hypothetical protein